MRNACKQLTQITLALALFAACAALARSQTRDSRLVSARAGGVNLVTGDVTVRRAGQQSWQTLLRTDDLRDGDAVRTGPDGRAEILLNPGSYLRLGEDTEFVMADTSLNTLRLRVSRGSALIEASIPDGGSPPASAPAAKPQAATVIEAAARDSAGFVMLIDTPKALALIVRSGVYRVNVAADGATEFVVRKGRALVGRDALTVKEGSAATSAAGGAVEVAKFDKNQKDDLDVWSRRRAQELALINSRLRTRALNSYMAGMSWDNFGWGNWPLAGLWYFDRRAMCYTYLPFVGWASPYGFGYIVIAPGLADYCGCFPRFGRWPINGVNTGNGGATTGGGSITRGGGGSTGGGGTTGGGGGGTVTGGGTTFGGGGNTITRPPVEAPAPTTPHSGGGAGRRMDPPR